MSHPIPEVALLDRHVRLLLRVLDVEYEGDTPNRLPERLIETYRTSLVAARGLPAIEATLDLANFQFNYVPPPSYYDCFDHAETALKERKTTTAQEALHRANGILVTEVSTGLSLEEMVKLATLSSTVVTIAELVNIGMSCDFGREPANVWSLIDEPTEGRLIEILVDTLHQNLRGRGAAGITPELVRQTIAKARPSGHAGLLVLLAAAGDGTLQRMRHQIDERTRRRAEQSAAFDAEFSAFAAS